MNWGKTVLIFQAIATLVLGIVFLMQVMQLDALKISKLEITTQKGVTIEGESPEFNVLDIKQRYQTASAILLVLSVMELMILMRLME